MRATSASDCGRDMDLTPAAVSATGWPAPTRSGAPSQRPGTELHRENIGGLCSDNTQADPFRRRIDPDKGPITDLFSATGIHGDALVEPGSRQPQAARRLFGRRDDLPVVAAGDDPCIDVFGGSSPIELEQD